MRKSNLSILIPIAVLATSCGAPGTDESGVGSPASTAKPTISSPASQPAGTSPSVSTEEPAVPKTTAARNEEVGETFTIGSSSLRIALGGLQRVGEPSNVVAPDGAKISSQRLELSGSSSVLVISTVVIDEQEFAAAAGQTPENTAKVGSRTGVLQRPDPGAEDYAFAFWEGGAMVTIAGTGVKDNEVESLANAVLTVETVISS